MFKVEQKNNIIKLILYRSHTPLKIVLKKLTIGVTDRWGKKFGISKLYNI